MTLNDNTRRANWQVLLGLALLTTTLAGCGEQRFQAPLATDFELPMLSGDGVMTLSEHRGDVVYLSFWASWCVPCRLEMPHLQSLWEQHRDQGFEVIGINVDEDPEAARQFARDHGIEFPLVRDADRSVATAYRVVGYPSHYLVGRDGRVHFSALGFTEDDALAVTSEVELLLRASRDAAD
ncbi:TlpA family protein disulfide reductase [Seongchinamella sediminis]|uniref:TlpA family protein disulfide reductase n=1 Tax=Seongchinamella sediminis TaxID=2283635 RepID=A0A3L7DUV6_9GAMM|nr:TlpA disulfide reductase family protein [Seongchinamella sediminis]RLQ21347.1 TlpA family protein disulfide reductase [Seongchinamella sediminis]